jgi:xanthine dehydrogenase YagT iron-sulfur-binding subunit
MAAAHAPTFGAALKHEKRRGKVDMADEGSKIVQTSGVTRRVVLVSGAGAAAVTMLPLEQRAEAQPQFTHVETGQAVHVSATVNGQPVALDIDSRASLLDLLRERLGLTGTKKGCDHGQCGACTVHLNGRPVSSCLTMASKIEGRHVTTIEGIASGADLHPMQQAFIDRRARRRPRCYPRIHEREHLSMRRLCRNSRCYPASGQGHGGLTDAGVEL